MEWKSGARIIIVCGTVGYLWQFAVTYSGPGTILVRSVAGVLCTATDFLDSRVSVFTRPV